MNRGTRWILLVVVAAWAAGCGQPKPREVLELRLNGKAIELKSSDWDPLALQFGQLCQVAAFVRSDIKVQDKAAGGAGGALSRSTQEVLERVRQSSHEIQGARTVSTEQTTLKLGPGIEGLIKEYNQLNPSASVDPQVYAKLRARLEALLAGWQIAEFYYSNTAPEASVKDYGTYAYQKVRLDPASLHCLLESSESQGARR